ncbi:putative quinol monooxygenase [Microbacterium trichothecenolyticum]
MNEPIVLHATFTAREGEADRVARLIGEYADLVRQEPGNVLFDASQLADAPERFFVYEMYRNEAAFQEHIDHPKGQAFNDKLTKLIVEPASELTFLKLVR